MTSELSRTAATLADLAHTLESGEEVEARIRHAAELVRQLMRSDACAVVHGSDTLAPARVVVPAYGSHTDRLGREAAALLDVVAGGADGRGSLASLRPPGSAPHLAVPLIAVGEVVGVVLVERAEGAYGRRELQLLAVAASQLGAYLAALEARSVLRRSELALREALAAKQLVDERKTRFMNVLSHELRNPLQPLRDAVHVLERAQPGSDSTARARAIIGRQVEHLSRLVEDLLDETRLSTGKVQLRRAPLDVADLVRRTTDDHRPLFQRADVALALTLPPGPLWVDGDDTRLAQVVGSLLSNALKFTSAGGHVDVSVEGEAPSTAAIRIRDDGVGMRPEILARVFEQYAQGDETLPRGGDGLGLGMALAKGLVDLHGGTVEARSEGPGRGSEFVVRLPLRSAGGVETLAALAPGATPTPRGVLVIDDNRDAADALQELLRLAGHDVAVARDGPTGVALARGAPPDVVLCDLDLPGMTGYDVARALGSAPELSRTLLVAVTGLGSPLAQQRAREAGFHRFLRKPLELPALERLLEQPDAPASRGPVTGR